MRFVYAACMYDLDADSNYRVPFDISPYCRGDLPRTPGRTNRIAILSGHFDGESLLRVDGFHGSRGVVIGGQGYTIA